MAKFNAKEVQTLRETFNKSIYLKRSWHTDPQLTMTLQEYCEIIDPTFKTIVGNPIIICKENKKGGIFYKMLVSLQDGEAELDLTYQLKDDDYDGPLYNEGDEIDPKTLMFCVEKFLDKEHGYVTGEIIEED